jgi:hypothetical protein
MNAAVFRQRRRHHALTDIGFHQHQRLAVLADAIANRSNIKRRMRPCRLREIFDDARNIIVAFDQEHVAGAKRRAQALGVARRQGLIALDRLFQIVGDQSPDPVCHPTHHTAPASFLTPFLTQRSP